MFRKIKTLTGDVLECDAVGSTTVDEICAHVAECYDCSADDVR